MKEVLVSLKNWSKENFGAVTKQIAELREKFSNLRAQGQNGACAEIRNTLDKMNELLYREEMMWLQRSRLDWL